MSRTLKSLTTLVVLIVVTACSKPPAEVMSAADQAQQAAMTAGAAEYAPDAMNEVSEAKAALDAEMAAQGEKMALTRSYKHAEELAVAYKAAAETAASTASAAKEQARNEASTLITESRATLDEVNGMLAAAPVGKGSRADLAAMKADLDAAATGLTEAEAALNGEMFLDAQSKARSAREIIDRVKASVEQAQTMRRGT